MSAEVPYIRERTQAERDESYRSSYWMHALEYGINYYVCGRYAVAARMMPVSASLFHHAVELLLKACLALDDLVEEIAKYDETYGHSLPLLWKEFRNRNPESEEHDPTIKALHKFELVRYPENLISEGGLLSIGFFENREQEPKKYRNFTLSTLQIDPLVALLMKVSDYNPALLRDMLGREPLKKYFELNNEGAITTNA
jgi:hypothetical protein